jgi:hypothetical protein
MSVTDEWVWSIGGMILTGETEVLGEKHYTALVVDVWMSMQHWWNDTDRGNWSTGRKTLYSVGGRCMNEYWSLEVSLWNVIMEVVGDVWMSMELWWNDTDRGNWSTGRKTLYSVGGRCMNEYGSLVELYWQGKTEVLVEKPVPVPLCTAQISHEPTCDRSLNVKFQCSSFIAAANAFSLKNVCHPWTVTYNVRQHRADNTTKL